MSVVFDLTQSGSGSAEIHAEPGDVITFELPETVYTNVLDQLASGEANGLQLVTGVTFAFNNAGAAPHLLRIAQSGSGSTTIDAQAGDVVTLALASTVFNNVAAQCVKWLNRLNSILGGGFNASVGITFVLNTAGGAT